LFEIETNHRQQDSASSLPPLSSTRVRLRTIGERDRAFLYDLMLSPGSGGRVRFAGATPSPEKIAASLWDSVLAQFIIEGAVTAEPLGLVAITSPNFRDSFAYLSALACDEAQGSGLVTEGVLLAINYAFCIWPFRKLYMEASDVSYQFFKSATTRYFVEEGRLKEHFFWNGEYIDLLILAIYRATWQQHAAPFLRRLRR
jgi:RimJ/RimL family protein N-acetyltransferase